MAMTPEEKRRLAANIAEAKQTSQAEIDKLNYFDEDVTASSMWDAFKAGAAKAATAEFGDELAAAGTDLTEEERIAANDEIENLINKNKANAIASFAGGIAPSLIGGLASLGAKAAAKLGAVSLGKEVGKLTAKKALGLTMAGGALEGAGAGNTAKERAAGAGIGALTALGLAGGTYAAGTAAKALAGTTSTAKMNSAIDDLVLERAIKEQRDEALKSTITKFKVVNEPPNPHLGRDIADIETDLKAINSLRAKTQRSGGNKDALKALDIQRKSLLEAQAIKRPEIATARETAAAKETAKDDVFTEKGNTAYMTDEQIEAAADAREAAIAKKKKKGGGGEGEGGAGGGGPRDSGGGSGLSSALKATEDKTIDPETQLPFTDELIKRKEITRETTKTPAIRRILREGEVANDDLELAATVVAEAIKKTKDGKYTPKSGLKNEQFSTMPVRDAEWFRRRQGEDANADADDALRRQNNPIPEGKVTPDRPKPKYTDEEVANVIKDNPRGADEGIIEHRIRINKIIENNKKNLEAAIRSMPDDMLTPVERQRREQTLPTTTRDNRVSLRLPEFQEPVDVPTEFTGMRMSDAPRGGGNRTPDIDPEEVRSAALAAIQLERAAEEAAAELSPSVKLERALAEKEYEKQFVPGTKTASETWFRNRKFPDPISVAEANAIIRNPNHPLMVEPKLAAADADPAYQLALEQWVPDKLEIPAMADHLVLLNKDLAPLDRMKLEFEPENVPGWEKMSMRQRNFIRETYDPNNPDFFWDRNTAKLGKGIQGKVYSVIDRNGKPRAAKVSDLLKTEDSLHEKNVIRTFQDIKAAATPAQKSLYLRHFPNFIQLIDHPVNPKGFIAVMDELRPMNNLEKAVLFEGRESLRATLKSVGFENVPGDINVTEDFKFPRSHQIYVPTTANVAGRRVLTPAEYENMQPNIRKFYNALEWLDTQGLHWEDLHPGNVMIDPKTGEYVAIDFGYFKNNSNKSPGMSRNRNPDPYSRNLQEAAEMAAADERLNDIPSTEEPAFTRANTRGLELLQDAEAQRKARLREMARQALIQQGLVRPKGK